MKAFATLVAFAILASAAPASAQIAPRVEAGAYKTDPAHTQITFTVNHLGFTDYRGLIAGATGTLNIDPKNPSAATVAVEIPTAGLTTSSDALTKHLKSPDFFDVATYPTISFKSTKVTVDGESAKITGDLTLHGVTKPVTLDARLTGAGPHPMSKAQTVGFHASTTISRSDFGIKFGVPAVGDKVDLQIEAAFEK